MTATSFPGSFPWLGGAPPPSQGKDPGNEVAMTVAIYFGTPPGMRQNYFICCSGYNLRRTGTSRKQQRPMFVLNAIPLGFVDSYSESKI